LQFLINAGADVNAQMAAGASATYVAVQQSQEKVLAMLVKEGADLDAPRDNGGTPLILAAQRINKPMLLQLMQAGAVINTASPSLGSPLFVAVEAAIRSRVSSDGDYTRRTSALECVSLILEAGGYVDAINQNLGVTALFLAAQASDEQCVHTLIAAGANCNMTRQTKSFTGGTALHNAAARGSAACMELLIAAGANVNARKRNGNSAIHSAAQIGDVGCLQMLLQHGANVHCMKNTGETALMLASSEGHVESVKVLLAAGAVVHVNQKSADGSAVGVTALFLAAKNHHIKCAECLLQAGAVPTFSTSSPRLMEYLQQNVSPDIHVVAPAETEEAEVAAGTAAGTAEEAAAQDNAPRGGSTKDETKPCMIKCTWQQKLELLQELVRQGANVNTKHDESVGELRMQEVVVGTAATAEVSVKHVTLSADGSTPLILAAKNGWEVGMRFFITAGANVNAENNTGHTPLHIVTAQNRTAMVRLLLSSGAMADVRKLTLETPLALAIQLGLSTCVQLLVQAGAVINPPSNTTAPLFAAVGLDRVDIVQHLLNAGAQVNCTLSSGITPIIAAAQANHAECLQLLVKHGNPNVDAAKADGSSAIHAAAMRNHHAVMQVLIDAFCDVNSARQDGMTPLLQVVQQEDSPERDKTIDMLLAAGVDVNWVSIDGTMAIQHAALNGDLLLLKKLLAAGANINALANDGSSAMCLAMSKGHAPVVALLLMAGANCLPKRQDGTTVLHLAAKQGLEAVTQQLVTGGSDINAATFSTNTTPLVFAASEGHMKCVHLLLRAGADPNVVQSNDGATAMHFVAQYGDKAAVRELLEAGADIDATMKNNATTLMLAAMNGQKEIVRILLGLGCGDMIFNPQKDSPFRGYSAKDFAIDKGFLQISEMLTEAGAVAPCKDKRSLVAKQVLVGGKSGIVMGLKVKLGLFKAVAGAVRGGTEYSIKFSDSDYNESVCLAQEKNGGWMYAVDGSLMLEGERVQLTVTSYAMRYNLLYAEKEKKMRASIETNNAEALVAMLRDGARIPDDKQGTAVAVLKDVERQRVCQKESLLNARIKYEAQVTRQREAAKDDTLRLEVELGVLEADLARCRKTEETAEKAIKLRNRIKSKVASAQMLCYECNANLKQKQQEAKLTKNSVKELETKIAALIPFIQSWQQNILKGARCAEVMEQSAHSVSTLLKKLGSAGGLEGVELLRQSVQALKDMQKDALFWTFVTIDASLAHMPEGSKYQVKLGIVRTELNAQQARLDVTNSEIAEAQICCEKADKHFCEIESKLAAHEPIVATTSVQAALDSCIRHILSDRRDVVVHELDSLGRNTTRFARTHVEAKTLISQAKDQLKKARAYERSVQVYLRDIPQVSKRAVSLRAQKVVATRILDALVEFKESVNLQLGGCKLLVDLAKDLSVAGHINSKNGQQIILFGLFREILETEATEAPVTRLRFLLSASRLTVCKEARKHVSAATHDLIAVVESFCNLILRDELAIQEKLLAIISHIVTRDCRFSRQLSDVNMLESLHRTLRHYESQEAARPMGAKAAWLAEVLVNAQTVHSSTELLVIVQAMCTVAQTPACLLGLGCKRLRDDLGIMAATSLVEIHDAKKILTKTLLSSDDYSEVVISADGTSQSRYETLNDILGITEIAEWIAIADTKSEGWSTEYLPRFINKGLVGIGKVRARFDEADEMREALHMAREPAFHLYASLDPNSIVSSVTTAAEDRHYQTLVMVLLDPSKDIKETEGVQEIAFASLTRLIEQDTTLRITHESILPHATTIMQRLSGEEGEPLTAAWAIPFADVTSTAERAVQTLAVLERLTTVVPRPNLSELTSIMLSVGTTPSTLAATLKVLGQDIDIILGASNKSLQKAAQQLSSTRQAISRSPLEGGPLADSLARLADSVGLAEWISRSCPTDGGSWDQAAFHLMLEHDIGSTKKALELFEEPGDLREMFFMKRDTAKELFNGLMSCVGSGETDSGNRTSFDWDGTKQREREAEEEEEEEAGPGKYERGAEAEEEGEAGKDEREAEEVEAEEFPGQLAVRAGEEEVL
jgi:ankyrin repeat protein